MFGEIEGVVSFENFFISLVNIPGVVVSAAPVVLLNSYLQVNKSLKVIFVTDQF